MSKEKRFNILATDGERIWELFFIVQKSKGDFYCGPTNHNFYYSRHHQQSHAKSKEGTYVFPPDKKQKLTELKGIEQLLSYSNAKWALEKGMWGKQYKKSKFDGSVVIDLRKFRERINIIACLLEPKNTDRLQLLTGIANPQIIIFTETNPWIVLSVFEPS